MDTKTLFTDLQLIRLAEVVHMMNTSTNPEGEFDCDQAIENIRAVVDAAGSHVSYYRRPGFSKLVQVGDKNIELK